MLKFTKQTYIWAYFTKDINTEESKCKICDAVYKLKKQYDIIKNHIRAKHTNSVPSKKTENWPFSMIQKDQVKCDNCDKKCNIGYYGSNHMKWHLRDAHNIYIESQNWLSAYNYIISNETMECIYCNIIFQNDVKHNYFNAIKHLIDAHQIAGISVEIRSTGIAEDVTVSSEDQQPTYNRNHYASSSLGFSTNATDTLTSHNNFLYLDGNAENVTVSSGCHQPVYNWNHHGISPLGFNTNVTDTLTTSHNNFSFLDRNDANVAVSSRCQQSTYDWNHHASSFLSSSTNPIDTSSTNPMDTLTTSYQSIHDYHQPEYEVDYDAIEDMLK